MAAGFEAPVIVSSVRQRNTVAAQLAALDCPATLIFEPMGRGETRLVSVVGLSGVIVIDTPDALLVTRVGHCQNVRKVPSI